MVEVRARSRSSEGERKVRIKKKEWRKRRGEEIEMVEQM